MSADEIDEVPSAEDLQKLTLRSIAAYAVRAARRNVARLHGVVDDMAVNEAFACAERFARVAELHASDGAAAAIANAQITDALAQLSSRRDQLAALAVTRVAFATINLLGILDVPQGSDRARRRLIVAARAAAGTARAAEVLDEPAAAESRQAARRDYDLLANKFGRHDTIVLGDPVEFSDVW